MAIPTPQQTIISTGTDPALAEYGNALSSAAYISDGNVTYNITQIEQTVQNNTLTNNFNNTAGGSAGQVQFNSNGLLTGDAGFTYNPNNDTIVVSGNVLTGSLSATANITSTANVNANIVNATNLRTNNLQYANGASYVFTAVTGNITFDEENIISTGNLKLQPDSACSSAYLDIFLTSGPDIHIAGNGETVILGTDEFANVAVNVNGNVSIQASTGTPYTWTFDSEGSLTVPGSILSNAALIVESNISSNNSGMSATGGGDTILYATDDVTIRANNNGTTKNWTFVADGTVILPNNTLNTGAESIDIASNNYAQLSFINSDIANASTGAVTYSYSWTNDSIVGQAIETKNAQTYEWIKDNDGTAYFPAGITIENNYKQYFEVIVNTDTGSGINLQVNIEVTSAGEMQLTGIANSGSGYDVGDSVYVNGSAINGTNILNDVYMTVDSVNGDGSVVSINDLTIVDTYTRPLDGVKFAGGGVVSGDDANGNVVIQTFDSEGPSSQTYAFTNQGTLESNNDFYIKSPNFVDVNWYNDDPIGVKNVGDSETTGFHAQGSTSTIYSSLYDSGGAEWNFGSDGIMAAPGSIHMNGDFRYFQVSVTTDTGSGSNLVVVVRVNNAGTVTITDISDGGQYYNTGDVLFIDGSDIGGHEIANQIDIEVDATGVGGVIEGTGQLIITGGIGPKAGLEFDNFAAIQTDDNSNGNLVLQSFNTTTNSYYYSVFDNTGALSVPGNLNITGNANVGNLVANIANITTANVTTGNITTINTGLVQNGNSNVVITTNANVTITAKSNATMIISDTGANITGTLNATGNANVGNLGTTTAIITTGNITTINTGLVQNGNSNIAITSNANITVTSKSNATMTITDIGANVTGYANISGNITAGNVSGAITLATLALKMPVYADATARDTAITSPTAGMIIYNTATANVQVYSGSAWGNITVS